MLALVLFASIELAADAGAGLRGERRALAQLHAERDDGSWTFVVETTSGPQAPVRTALSLALDRDGFVGEARFVPGLSGFWFGALAAGLHAEPFLLELRAKAASLGSTSLRGLGVRAELESEWSESTRSGLSVELWALQLSTPLRGEAFVVYGERTFDWSQRASCGVWLTHDFGGLSLSPSLELALPPQSDGFEPRGSVSAEIPIGGFKGRIQAAIAHTAPDLWLGEIALGLARPLP